MDNSSKQRVIFIEPREGTRKIYLATLKPEQYGWDLDFAASGPEALALNARNPADILVASDLLPELDGTAVLEELRDASPETIRFLMVPQTDSGRPPSMVGPAQQIVVSPLSPDVFADQVNTALALRTLVDNPEIFKIIGDGDALPSLPRVFDQLNAKLSSLDTSLTEIAQIISQDVVLTSKVLHTVNSALFNLRTPVENLAQAVSLLGTSTIRSIVFAQGVYEAFKHPGLDENFFEDLNSHSILCAKVIEKILYEWGCCRRMIDQAVFCCFAHDLGKIILARYAQDQWAESLRLVREREGNDIEIEREVLGIGHAEIGAYLLATWGFSNEQIAAVAFHHDPALSRQQARDQLCALHIVEHSLHCDFQHSPIDWDWVVSCGITEEELAQYGAIADQVSGADESE